MLNKNVKNLKPILDSNNHGDYINSLLPTKIYGIFRNGWYRYWCVKTFCDFNEALTFLGFDNKEDYEDYLNSMVKTYNCCDYDYYTIEEINLGEIVNEKIKYVTKITIETEGQKIAEASEKEINRLAKEKFRQYKEDLVKKIKEL